MKPALDDKIHYLLNEGLVALEGHFDADILTYFGTFEEGGENFFLNLVEGDMPINIDALRELRLEIDDYSDNMERRKLIRDYYELVSNYVSNGRFRNFVHTRKYI